jgi:hypothetical protein
MTEHKLITRPSMSLGTARAIEKLKDGKPGDEFTVPQMEEITGENCGQNTRGRNHVCSAINHVLTQHQIHWSWSRDDKVWRCCTHEDSLGIVDNRNKSIGRRARKSLRMLASVDEKELNEEERREKRLSELQNSLAITSISAPLRKRLSKAKVVVEPDMDQLAKLIGRNGRDDSE